MNKLFVLFVCMVLLSGCATNYNVPAIDVDVGKRNVRVRKIPLNVGILIPDEKYVMTKTMSDFGGPTTLTVPFGSLLKQLTMKILPSTFASVQIVGGEPYPPGIEALLIPTIEDFYKEPVNTTPSVAGVTLRSDLVDLAGVPIWSNTYKAQDKEIMPATWSYEANARFWGGQIARALANALSDTARDVSSSREIQAFVSPKGQPAAPNQTTHAAPPKFVRSDVDEPPSLTVKPNTQSVALVIGIEKYREKLPSADFAAHDARVVSDYLVKALGFAEENVVTLLNDRASMSDVTKYIEKWLPNNTEKEGSVFIYYSGHGAPNPKTGDAYLVPYDGDPSFIDQTGYSLKRLYDNLAKLPAKHVIVALDACFSGAGGKSVSAKGSRALVRVEKTSALNIAILAASLDNQISVSYQEKGHGVFTYFLLKGIKEMLGEDRDSNLLLGELYNYVKPQVERTSRRLYNNEQTPQLITADEQMKKIGLR